MSTELTIKGSPIAYYCDVRGDADKRRTLGGIQLERDVHTPLGYRDCGRIRCYLICLAKISLVLFRLGAHFNSAQYGIGKSPVAITGLVCLRFHCCHRGFYSALYVSQHSKVFGKSCYALPGCSLVHFMGLTFKRNLRTNLAPGNSQLRLGAKRETAFMAHDCLSVSEKKRIPSK